MMSEMAEDLTRIARCVGEDQDSVHDLEFSFCSLVTSSAQYRTMVKSLRQAGFDDSCAEFLYLDNREDSQGDGFTGLNRLANAARGRLVIFCHQDLLAIDGPQRLRDIVAELDASDPAWAVLGNAGVRGNERYYYLNEKGMVIAGPDRRPAERVDSLDEDLLILRQDARLGFSCDLDGFHFYGTDLVMQAQLRGRASYVVDFRVEHLGAGRIDKSFWDACDRFEAKYSAALAGRAIPTTCTVVHVGDVSPRTRRRRERERSLGPDHVGWAHRFKRALRSRISGYRLTLDGLTVRCPPEIPFATYKALRKGYYKQVERTLIRDHLPSDLPVVHLGSRLGVLSGLINGSLNPGVALGIVTPDSERVALCRANALAGGESRRIEVLAGGIGDTPGDGSPITLAEVLARLNIEGPYALVCDIGGAEFDLMTEQADALEECQMLVARLCPDQYYARGETILTFLTVVERVGLKPVGSAGNVLAAGRVVAI